MISSPYIFPVSVDIDKEVFSDLHIYGDGDLEGWVDTVITIMSPWAGTLSIIMPHQKKD